MPRSYDFFDEVADQEAAERRRVALQEAQARIAQDEKAAAERAQKDTERTLRFNRVLLLREYEIAGVRPPFTDEDGSPRVSLTLLRSFGWEVQNISGENVLVAPKSYRGKVP